MKLKPLLFIALGAAVLVSLFVVLRPAQPVPENKPAIAQPETSAPSAGRHYALRIGKRTLVSGPGLIRVSEGEWVTLGFVSDEACHVHLHGYDLMLSLEPGKPALLKFQANRTGRFEYEIEEAGAEIGALEVEPR